MSLAALLRESGLTWRPADGSASELEAISVGRLCMDSRAVTPGALFVAFDGLHVRGLDHAQAAIEAGAVAVVADRHAELRGAPLILVADARAGIGPLASAFYDHPSRTIDVLAVTGTNGKTTTAMLAANLLNACGRRAAALGTLGLRTPA